MDCCVFGYSMLSFNIPVRYYGKEFVEVVPSVGSVQNSRVYANRFVRTEFDQTRFVRYVKRVIEKRENSNF
jgi:hypothetical protein